MTSRIRPNTSIGPAAPTNLPRIAWVGDSIGYGVGSATVAGFRTGFYYNGVKLNSRVNMVGSQSFAGPDGFLAIDPTMFCYPGATITSGTGNSTIDKVFSPDTITAYAPQIIGLQAGTNDITASLDVQAAISTQMDDAWNVLNGLGGTGYIVQFPILLRLDAKNSVVITTNAAIPSIIASKSYKARVIYPSGYYNGIPSPTVGVNMFDNLHPNEIGYGYLWPILWNAIAPVLPGFYS